MGTYGCVRPLTTCARVSSLCESTEHLEASCLTWQVFWFQQSSTILLYRYENGQVGDAHINTQEAKIHKEILQVIASMSRWHFKLWRRRLISQKGEPKWTSAVVWCNHVLIYRLSLITLCCQTFMFYNFCDFIFIKSENILFVTAEILYFECVCARVFRFI